jgi:hypothetical protein
MFSYFYNRLERSSEEQLHEDFGEFPPIPLQCVPPASTFVVVHVRGPGAWVNYWRRSAELLEVLESAPETVTPEILEALSGLHKINVQTVPEPGRAQVGRRYVVPRPFVRALLIWLFRRADTFRSRLVGHVMPITQQDCQITLLAHARRMIADVLTHEHLHFLQHRDSLDRNKKVREPQQVLKDEGVQDPYVLYLLEHREAEARLHELVLSYYRERGKLPQTLDTFLSMLADWKTSGEILELRTVQVGLKMRGTGRSFKLRSEQFSAQLSLLISSLRNPEATAQFICEVLPC